MKKRPSSIARTLAVLALAAAFVAMIAIVSAALDENEGGSSGKAHAQRVHHREPEAPKKVPATYVIKSGDTLTAIAHATGVSVAKIERLNPEVDPQILIAGETLKLK
jgi:LysM repeat protein